MCYKPCCLPLRLSVTLTKPGVNYLCMLSICIKKQLMLDNIFNSLGKISNIQIQIHLSYYRNVKPNHRNGTHTKRERGSTTSKVHNFHMFSKSFKCLFVITFLKIFY